MTERLTFVDENDQPIGVGDRKEAWKKGYYTRNIRVVISDENGRFLSQKRSTKKDTYPGMWTVAASGHVDDGESWDTAALRETIEEVGVSVQLKPIGTFNFSSDEGEKKVRQIIHLYEGHIDSSARFILEPDEVDDIRWFELDELKALIAASPNEYTPSLRETITRFY